MNKTGTGRIYSRSDSLDGDDCLRKEGEKCTRLSEREDSRARSEGLGESFRKMGGFVFFFCTPEEVATVLRGVELRMVGRRMDLGMTVGCARARRSWCSWLLAVG
jgi:hypothetical protein